MTAKKNDHAPTMTAMIFFFFPSLFIRDPIITRCLEHMHPPHRQLTNRSSLSSANGEGGGRITGGGGGAGADARTTSNTSWAKRQLFLLIETRVPDRHSQHAGGF